MEFLKKLSLTILVLLFFMSIIKDLTTGTAQQTISSPEEEHEETETEATEPPTIHNDKEEQQLTDQKYISYKVEPGDTVLSIVESINETTETMQINKIIEDFKQLNPAVDPHQIKPDVYYLFPIYTDNN